MDKAAGVSYAATAEEMGLSVADGSTDFPNADVPGADLPLPVGERLRQARESRHMALEDVSTQTRVPLRHLEAIERSDWGNLPAPTYSIGFAKAYAETVGLDRQEIGDELRVELGGGRAADAVETFQPADPARVPPRTIAIIAALVAATLLAGYGYYRTVALGDVQPRILEAEAVTPVSSPVSRPQPVPVPATAAAAASSGPVVITAKEDVWLKVYERDGKSLFEDTLAGGKSFEVPVTAADPLLRTSRAELLAVAVGGADVPQVAKTSTLVKDLSLKPEALRGGSAPSAAKPSR